jgi:pyruvate,water dikinase
MTAFIKKFSEINLADVADVGGKNASLGEMYTKLSSKGILVPDGFATTAFAFQKFLEENNLKSRLSELMASLDRKNFSNFKDVGSKARQLITHALIKGIENIKLAEQRLSPKKEEILNF